MPHNWHKHSGYVPVAQLHARSGRHHLACRLSLADLLRCLPRLLQSPPHASPSLPQAYAARYPVPGTKSNFGNIDKSLYYSTVVGGVVKLIVMNNYVRTWAGCEEGHA